MPSLSTTILLYSKADWDGLCSYLLDADFSTCFNSDNIALVWVTIEEAIYDGTDMFIPKLTIKKHQHPQWFNSSIHHRIKCLRTLRRKLKTCTSNHFDIRAKIQILETSLKDTMMMAKTSFETNNYLINSFSHDVSRIYRYIHKAIVDTTQFHPQCFPT